MSIEKAPTGDGNLVSEGIGLTHEENTAKAAENRKQVATKQKELLATARKTASELFKSSTPAPQAPKSAEKAPVAAPVAPQAAPSTDAAAFMARMEQQAAQKAAQLSADAEKRVQAASSEANKAKAEYERKLQLAKTNQYAFLKEGGLDVDAWNARLMNGGEATPVEKLQAELNARMEKAEAETHTLRLQLHNEKVAAARVTVIAGLHAMADEHFPLVAANIGVEAALDAMTAIARQTGKAPNPEEYFRDMERNEMERMQQVLKNPKAAAKLGVGDKSQSKAEVVESPRTMTNKTTSSVGSQAPTSSKDPRALREAGRAKIRELIQAGRLNGRL